MILELEVLILVPLFKLFLTDRIEIMYFLMPLSHGLKFKSYKLTNCITFL